MSNLIIFTNSTYIWTTIIAMLFMILSGLYLCIAQSNNSLAIGVKYIILGLVIDFISSALGYNINEYSQNVPVNLLVSTELLFKLTSMLLICIASTDIMLGKISRSIYVPATALIGLGLIIYFCFIAPNGNITNVMRILFPLIGLAYLTASYFTQCFRRHNIGFITGCLSAGIATYFSAMNISSQGNPFSNVWYITTCIYIGFSLSFLLSQIDICYDKISKSGKIIQKYNQRVRDIIQSSPFPIVISRLSDDSILLANDTFMKLFNIKEKEVNHYKFKDFFVDADNRRLLNTYLEKQKIIKDFEILVKSQNSDTPFWLSTSANIIDFDYDIAIYAAFQDITDRKKREDMLQTQATHDPLTSLYNRRYFESEVTRRISAQTDDVFSIFMIDADHFKNVNDTYGHKTGDKVLMVLASTAEKALRENDIVARYGGEEFIVYLSQTGAEEAKVVADRLREAISRLVVKSDAGEDIRFTVSIGISSSTASKDINELIKMSDMALYKAKENGRNQCIIYHPEYTQNMPVSKNVENVHPAFSPTNNIEISLLSNLTEDDK